MKMNILKQSIVLSSLAAIFTPSQAMDEQQNSLLMHSIRSYHTLERKISEGDAEGFCDLLRSSSNYNSSEVLDQQELIQLKERSQKILDEANAKIKDIQDDPYPCSRNKSIVVLNTVQAAAGATTIAGGVAFFITFDLAAFGAWVAGAVATVACFGIRDCCEANNRTYQEKAFKQMRIQRAIDARLFRERNISSVSASEDTPLLVSDENV
ncbi:MAG: hypothetical protein M1114_04085 [Candidatus Dependentiae bacterium]|nr:hypothetical protein [Candidatus Dependentiae bacterium]